MNESTVVLNAIVCIISGHIIISVADNVKNHECVYLSVISSLATYDVGKTHGGEPQMFFKLYL